MSWETVIGLEVHCELKTESKIFCSCTTAFGGQPNTHCCPVCVGMPGTLPVFNQKVLAYAVKAGLALNCEITRYNKFDRKNYFYPDLPKAYQISQLYLPFATDGHVDIATGEGKEKTIRIHEIHMEEDAGKLIHSTYGDTSFPDYNRCGVPLIEIVSQPDFRSAEEVVIYLEKLKSIFEYLDISDVKMEEGSMRADVNLSMRRAGDEALGTRTEMKNINSFRAIERAIAFEAQRQIEVLESGGRIIQETRRWDDNKGKSFAMRSKENAQDYRYFPEPDIAPISISEEMIASLKAAQPELADQKKKRYCDHYGISDYDGSLLTKNKFFAQLFEDTAGLCNEPKEVANWMIGQTVFLMNRESVSYEDLKISPRVFARFILAMKSGTVNRGVGRDIFEMVFSRGESFDVDQYIEAHGLARIDDEDAIAKTVHDILAKNTKTVEEYKSGKTKVYGFFVGECMKALKGKANPEIINKLINEELAKM